MFRLIFILAGLFGFSAILSAMINQYSSFDLIIPAWVIAVPIVGLFIVSEYYGNQPSRAFSLFMGLVGLVALAVIPLVWIEAIETLAGKNEIVPISKQ
ncbi:MAG: hypothetical protein OQK35_03765 [Alphaproteobacteria bacterium]|nr:hypothetical protein [Alphaproteobacteria bacterium]